MFLMRILRSQEMGQSDVVELEDLIRFLEACPDESGMELGEDRDLYREIDDYLRQFVTYQTVFKTHASDDGINISGAKNVIKKLCDCGYNEADYEKDKVFKMTPLLDTQNNSVDRSRCRGKFLPKTRSTRPLSWPI